MNECLYIRLVEGGEKVTQRYENLSLDNKIMNNNDRHSDCLGNNDIILSFYSLYCLRFTRVLPSTCLLKSNLKDIRVSKIKANAMNFLSLIILQIIPPKNILTNQAVDRMRYSVLLHKE